MARRRNRLRQNALYCATLGFFTLTRCMPLGLARRLAILLADIAFHVLPRVKTIGRANLDMAYGNSLSETEKRRILRTSVRNVGLVAAEFSHLPALLSRGIAPLVRVKGLEHVDRTKKVILLGAHQGNWELMIPVGGKLGLQPAAVVREFEDPRMNALVNRVRQGEGITLVPKNNAMSVLVREINNGACIGILADQNPRENGVPVTFFGQQTWGSIGPALLAIRAKADIYPISIIRTEDGNYLFEFYPALKLMRTGNLFRDLQINTQRCQDALETLIRAYPEQWLWLHRRWKTREHLEQAWKEREAKETAKMKSALSADHLEP